MRERERERFEIGNSSVLNIKSIFLHLFVTKISSFEIDDESEKKTTIAWKSNDEKYDDRETIKKTPAQQQQHRGIKQS